MSKLSIIDLHQEEELSSSEMAKATGGMDGAAAFSEAATLLVVGKALNNLGYTEAGNYADGYARGLVNGAFP